MMPSLGQKLVGGLGAPRPARISLNDGKFTLYMDSGAQHPTVAPALQIQVIFVGGNSHVSKCFYDEETYDADTPNAPVCWSDNGVAPSDQVQTPVSATCTLCPKNQWIGKGAGATPPACSDRKKTAVLVAGAGDTVFLLDIPPASLKPFKQYMAYLGGEVRQDPEYVLTGLSMENRILKFAATGHVSDAMKPAIKQIVDNPATDEVVNEHDRPHQLSLGAPIAGPGLPARPPVQQFVQQLETVDIIPEVFTDPRFAQAAADQAAREAAKAFNQPEPLSAGFAQHQPMTAQEAQAHHEGNPVLATMGSIADLAAVGNQALKARKQRSDKGVPRKDNGAAPARSSTEIAPIDERNPPPMGQHAGGFIQPEPAKPQFGMAQPAPAPQAMDDMLSKAFGLRVGK